MPFFNVYMYVYIYVCMTTRNKQTSILHESANARITIRHFRKEKEIGTLFLITRLLCAKFL